MSNSQEQLTQQQKQEKIENLNDQQTELKQIQIQQPLIQDQQQIVLEFQKSDLQYQQMQEKQTTIGIKKEDSVDKSNNPQEIPKTNQQTEPDQVQVQAVVITIDQKKQQQIQQQNEQAQKLLEEQLKRHIEKELITGLNKIAKVTLCFVSIMIVLQTALMIAAIIARAQGTDCVRSNDGDKKFEDIQYEVGVWFIIYIIFSGISQILFAIMVLQKVYYSKKGISNQASQQCLKCITSLVSSQAFNLQIFPCLINLWKYFKMKS